MQKLSLSLVVITLNEEKNLQRCLASVPFASEIIVVDSGSTDQTQKIAESMGAKFYFEKWRGFGAQKSFAVSLASHDWVLCLDADEALSEESQQEILAKFSQLEPEAAYKFPRLSYHLGRWIRHGGWHPDYQVRLFHRKHSQWSSSAIHEKVESKHQISLQHNILHWVFDSLSTQVLTNNKYSTLLAQQMIEKNKSVSGIKIIIKTIVKFFELYIFKLGFLDGVPGLIIALGGAYSVSLKWSKLWEHKNVKK